MNTDRARITTSLLRRLRAGALCGLLAAAGLSHAGLIDRGSGVVYDTVSGLDWEQSPSTSQINWIDANTYVDNLALDGRGWRLPHKIELQEMYAQLSAITGCRDCTGDQGPFDGLELGYWTDLTYWAGQPGAYYVGFWRPDSFAGLFQTTPGWVWAVREGAQLPLPSTAWLVAAAVGALRMTRRRRLTRDRPD
jgi:hypothetical protein